MGSRLSCSFFNVVGDEDITYMKKVAVLSIHGMGETDSSYSVPLVEDLRNLVGVSEWERDIHFESIYYQGTLQRNQERVWMAMNKFPLEASRLRRLMLYGFSDAGSLEYSAHRDRKLYEETQKIIYDSLHNAYQSCGGKMVPVLLIAQSLGCQVISNYIWDSQKKKGIFTGNAKKNTQKDKFCRLESCQHFVTTGCNIPLFVSGLSKIECFKKPNIRFRWDNFYDSDDFLGWPVSPLDESFVKAGVRDHHINSGGLITSQTWFSHNKYWSDKDVLRPLSRWIIALMNS